MANFDAMYAKFYDALRVHKKVVDISREFTNDKNIKDMLQYMWHLEELHDNIKIVKVRCTKNDEIADKKRKLGNEYFKKKMLDNALSYYNESIINAVHPGIGTSPNSSSVSLSYGYGNRSALLYEMKRFDLCLLDIKRAFYYNYPTDLHEKLILREIKCHMAENNLLAAKQSYDDYIDNDRYKNNKKLLMYLKKQMTDLEDGFTIKNRNDIECKIPDFKDFDNVFNVHKFFPSVSDALEFTCSDKGRGFVAKRDIMPGEVLMKEKAYSAVLINECLLTHCSYCLEAVKYSIVPCISCTNVIFCNEKCRDGANKLFHTVECPLLSTIAKLDMGMCSLLGFRVLCQTDVKEFLKQFCTYEVECLAIPQTDIGFNPSGVYQPDDLRTVFHLVTNKHVRGVSDLFMRCLMALISLKLLDSERVYEDIPEISNLNMATLSPDQVRLAAALCIFSMSFPCNAFSITDPLLTTNSRNYCLSKIGVGVFPTFSLVNHSCDPNMARTSYGCEMIGISTQHIIAGSEIFGNYGKLFTMEPVISRNDSLKKQYYFDCSCNACTEDWPMSDGLPSELGLKCPNCCAVFDLLLLECSKCKKSVNDLKNIDTIYKDFSTIIKKKFELHKEYSTTILKLANSLPNTDDIKIVLKMIWFMNKYCVLPTKMFTVAQEYLKLFLDMCRDNYKILQLLNIKLEIF